MDPNESLRLMRETILRIQRIEDGEDYEGKTQELAYLASTLATLSDSLDSWMSGGGFVPSAWARNRRAQ